MKSFLNLVSVDDALRLVFSFPVLEPVRVGLQNAYGLRLAQDFYAPVNLPGFARSTVDGYAVAANDVFGASETSPGFLSLVGSVQMGQVPTRRLGSGEAMAIATGAMLPEGADCAVMLEYTRSVPGDLLEVTRSVAPGENIVGAAEDAAAGSLLLKAGTLIRPQELGILAAFGTAEVDVIRAARVEIFSTGDELVPIDQEPRTGQIRDTNSWTVGAMCREAQAGCSFGGILRDNLQDLRGALNDSRADIVVISGGSSAGMRDLTVEAFASLPDSEILIHGVAISPGKPFILARAGRKALVGLPGHVAGAFNCARVFLLPLISRFQGASDLRPQPYILATLTRSVVSAQGRRDFVRSRLERVNGGYAVTPLPASSALLASLTQADGYVVCPEDQEGLFKGAEVPFYPYAN